MTKTTLSEETQELLDEVYDVELANEFIENHGEDYFLTYYEKYEELVREYDQNLIDEFAEQISSDCGYVSRDMPSWIEIDWQKTWDNALSYDYTQIGYAIFNDNY